MFIRLFRCSVFFYTTGSECFKVGGSNKDIKNKLKKKSTTKTDRVAICVPPELVAFVDA